MMWLSRCFLIRTLLSQDHKVINTVSDREVSIKRSRRVHVRKVASFIGQIISIGIVIGSVSQVMTRNLSKDILSAYSWNSYMGQGLYLFLESMGRECSAK